MTTPYDEPQGLLERLLFPAFRDAYTAGMAKADAGRSVDLFHLLDDFEPGDRVRVKTKIGAPFGAEGCVGTVEPDEMARNLGLVTVSIEDLQGMRKQFRPSQLEFV